MDAARRISAMSQPHGGHPGEAGGRGGAPEEGYPPGYPPPYPQEPNEPGHPGQRGYGSYPAYPGYPSYSPRRPSLIARLQPAAAASIAVLVCSLICYFAGYATGGARFYIAIYVLLAGGLLSAVHAMRSGKATAEGSASPNTIVIGAVLSVVGGLGVLFEVIHLPTLPVTAVIILIFALLQLVIAVAAFLLESGLLVLPPPRQAAPPPWAPAGPPAARPSGGREPHPQWDQSQRSGPPGDSAGAQTTQPGMAWPASEDARAPEPREHSEGAHEQASATSGQGRGGPSGKATGPGPTAYLPTTPENAPHGYGTAPRHPPRQ
jgi:hypothetical protein